MSADMQTEYPVIEKQARLFNVDPFFLAAVRMQENGDAGREFGVLSVPAPDYASQLRICAESVRNALARFMGNPVTRTAMEGGETRLCYSEQFVKGFAERWAPPKAPNDPTNLNLNWQKGVNTLYRRFIARNAVV